MSRLLLIAAAALLCASALVPAASAVPLERTCEATSPRVVGGKVVGKLTATNLNPVQARFATCEQAGKVMRRATALGVEEPRPVRSFYCRPTVDAYDDNRVRYVCTFRGADTPIFIKLTFGVTYRQT